METISLSNTDVLSTTEAQLPPIEYASEKPDEQPIEDYLAWFEAEHELWDEYYHACGRW